jgi:hypothetical protein
MLSFKQFIKESAESTIDAKDHPLYQKRSVDDVKPKSDEEVKKALDSDKAAKKIINKGISHPEGTRVGARLNLNVLRHTTVPVQTIHKGNDDPNEGSFHGDAESYQGIVHLKNASFHVSHKAREKVARDIVNKEALASVDGNIHHPDKPNFDGVEARFNPKNTHLFIDGNNHAVKSAEDVTVHGHRVYMRGKITYHTKATAPARPAFSSTVEGVKYHLDGNAPSSAKIRGHDESDKENIKEQTESTFDAYFGN